MRWASTDFYIKIIPYFFKTSTEVYLIYTHQLMHLYILFKKKIKFTLKHLKRS